MKFTFRLLTKAKPFLKILPQDWQDEIVPFWNDFKDSSQVYVIEENEHIIGGGIIFSKPPPDLENFKEEAQQWFNNGFLYIGFLWIDEDKRNQNLGSFWLEELKRKHPEQNYWLLIEEERLHRFYQKNGFLLNKTVEHPKNPDWLYSFEPLLR